MSKRSPQELAGSARHWRSAAHYRSLLLTDRRGFAWEWLRRHPPYRKSWKNRDRPPEDFGLLAYEDPDHGLTKAKPIWAIAVDPWVLPSRPSREQPTSADDLLDVRQISEFVSVQIDECDVEHWLITDGCWSIRLDLHEGTLLGGPVMLQHFFHGFASAESKIHALRQLGALVTCGSMPGRFLPQESRAARWILELRTADALATGASHQEMARVFYRAADGCQPWRSAGDSYRLRIQRLVRVARQYLADPFAGPWFS